MDYARMWRNARMSSYTSMNAAELQEELSSLMQLYEAVYEHVQGTSR